MNKLIIEVNFDEEINEDELWEIKNHLTGLISEEFCLYGEHYPAAQIISKWVDK